MSVIFQGSVTYDYVITGLVAVLLVGLVVLSAIIYLYRELQTTEEALRQANEKREQFIADLVQHSTQLETAAEVSQATIEILEPDELSHQIVDLIRDRFDLYYVGLFRLDETQRFAVLQAGAGEAGQQVMQQGYKLDMSVNSLINQCIAWSEAQVALTIEEETAHLDPLLPETRSELALPLRSRGRVIGAMTVQSDEEAAFDQAYITTLQIIADQVAVAIDNAQLFAQTQAALAQTEAAYQRYTGRSWTEYTRIRTVSGYEQTDTGTIPLHNELLPETKQAIIEGQTVTTNVDNHTDDELSTTALVTPIMLRDQPIGALGLKHPKAHNQWSDDEIALVQEIAEQFALAAENLRLFDDAQRRAVQEQLIGEITNQMQQATDLESLMRITAEELNKVLDASRTYVRLDTELALKE